MILKNCDMNTFSDVSKGKKIACYGIGGEFCRIMDNYAGYAWMDRITWLVDGNLEKAGEKHRAGDRTLEVICPEDLRKQDLKDAVIFVTCLSFEDVVRRLDRFHELDQAECYLFHFMFGISEGRDIRIRWTDEMRIPPVLHYCWFGRQALPDRYKEYIDSWRRYCPDYEIIEWNEDNCDIGETAFTKEAYEAGKFGFVPDYFRLKIIYENGGIYLDTDIELLKNLDDLRYNEGYCGLQCPGEAACGLGFGAVKGNRVVESLMERYKQMHFLKPDGSFDETISPVYQTRDMKKMGMNLSGGVQNIDGMTVYPVEVLSPKNIITGETYITPHSYSIHHYDGTWVSGERLARKKKRQKDVQDILERMQD